MITEITPPVSTNAKPATPSASTFTWLIHHVTLLLVVVGLGVGLFYFVENIVQKHDLAQEEKYNSLLTTQAQQTQTLQKQLTIDEQNWTAIQTQLLKQNSALEQKILNQNQVTQKQVQNDATLDAQQTAARISQQTNAKQNEITAADNTIILDLPIGRVVTSDLDLLSGAQADLAATKKELDNETQIVNNDSQQSAKQNQVIAGLQAQNVEQVKACAAETGALKAKMHKNGVKRFFQGVGVGLGTGIAIVLKHFI